MSLFLTEQDQRRVDLIVNGYIRKISSVITNRIIIPQDVIGICIIYFIDGVQWKIPISTLTSALHKDFTTLTGPDFYINGYKFILKAKRSKDKLYFGAWYQCDETIQQALYTQFSTAYDINVANKIIESFNFIIKDEEFDDVQLILHDMSDPTYSCILEHVESELRSSLLLIAYGNIITSINNINQNIIRILTTFNPGPKFIFRARFTLEEMQMEFRRLYRFNTHQVTEKPAEMCYRNKNNDFRDTALDYDRMVKNKTELTLNCHIDILEPDSERFANRDNNVDQDLRISYVIEKALRDRIYDMNPGERVYLPLNYGKHERFCIFVEHQQGQHWFVLQQLFPNLQRRHHVMVTEIGQVKVEINGTRYSKLSNVRFDQEDDVIIISKVERHIWRKIANDNYEWILRIDLNAIQ